MKDNYMFSPMFMEKKKGTYVLVITAFEKSKQKIGSLGILTINPGYYFYTGSAFGPGGLRARLSHHLIPATKPHWHIDYLRQVAEPTAIGYTCSPENLEHKLAMYLYHLPGLTIPLPRFGASDCHCTSHLFYSATLEAVEKLKNWEYNAIGCQFFWEEITSSINYGGNKQLTGFIP
jgi:Uri superfamily endonuclease